MLRRSLLPTLLLLGLAHALPPGLAQDDAECTTAPEGIVCSWRVDTQAAILQSPGQQQWEFELPVLPRT